MKYWLFFISLMGISLQLLGRVDDSILPLMDSICFQRYGQNINERQKESLQQAAQHPNQKLRVMTYNMLYNVKSAEDKLPAKHRWDCRKPRLLEYLNYASADIICSQELQETQIQEVMKALGTRYCFYGVKTRGSEGRSDTNAIFFNPHRLELIEASTIPYQDEFGQNAFTYCYFRDTLLDKKFVVINTKLTWGYIGTPLKRRFAEASQLSQFASLLPANEAILVMGDFNALPFIDATTIEKVMTKNNLKDAIKVSVFGHYGPLCSITNSKILLTPFVGPELNGFIPDHIYVNDQVEVFAHGIDVAKINGEFASDHLPVVADIFFK